jgi:hypothetical protein
MTYPPSPDTSFTVASFEFERTLVWAKAHGVWAWSLDPDGDGTRLVVRLRTGPDWRHAARSPIGGVLVEVGDFPMMRKMLLGIKERAEYLATERSTSLVDGTQTVQSIERQPVSRSPQEPGVRRLPGSAASVLSSISPRR